MESDGRLVVYINTIMDSPSYLSKSINNHVHQVFATLSLWIHFLRRHLILR